MLNFIRPALLILCLPALCPMGELAAVRGQDASLAGQPSQDIVTLRPTLPKESQPWNSARSSDLLGRIERFDHQELLLTVEDGTTRTIDSALVQAIRFAWPNDTTAAAIKLFDDHRYREAITALDEARKSGIPRWQQQIVISYVIRAASEIGNARTAGILFLNLAASQPAPLLYADMPLCWTVQDVPQPLATVAQEWLAGESDEAKLLGASWLLLGPERELATKTLTKLQASSNSVVAQLAAAQAWRLVPPPQSLEQLAQWMDYRDRMLQPLQLGPTEFLADRLQRIGETDLAIGQWMRIATLHADRYDRARRALTAAADSLTRQGRAAEAKKIEAWIDELDGK